MINITNIFPHINLVIQEGNSSNELLKPTEKTQGSISGYLFSGGKENLKNN